MMNGMGTNGAATAARVGAWRRVNGERNRLGRVFACGLLALLVAATLSGTTPARAQAATDAEYQDARALLESERVGEAVARYRALAERSNEARAWLGLAVATNLAGDPTLAATYVEHALARTSDAWLVRNRTTAEGYARQFWPLVGRLVITCEAAGVEVFVDGVPVGVTPLADEGVVVASGERRVELRSSTHENQALAIRVAPSDYAVTPEIQLTRRAVTLVPRRVPMVGSVLVRTNVEGAAIFVDETYRATAPVDAPLEVEPGTRRITVRATGYADGVEVVQVDGHPAGTEVAPIELLIELDEQANVGSTGGVSNAVRYSVLAAGGALVAGAAVTSGLWASSHSDLDQYCADGTCVNTADARDARDRFRVMRLSSMVLGGVGIAAVVTSFVLPRGHAPASAPVAAAADVACDSHGCVGSVSGRF